MKATVSLPMGDRTVEIGWLDAVRLIASRKGYNDVDVEPMIGERHEITVSGPGLDPVTRGGKTLPAACEAMINALD